MGYVVIVRGETSSLRVLLDREFSTRQEALAALRQAITIGAVRADDESMVGDLSQLAPVLVMGVGVSADAVAEGAPADPREAMLPPDERGAPLPVTTLRAASLPVATTRASTPPVAPPLQGQPFRSDEMFPVLPAPVIADTMPPAGSGLSLAPTQVFEGPAMQRFETCTCRDCVYFRTCPKSGRAAPESCGAFQWRAP